MTQTPAKNPAKVQSSRAFWLRVFRLAVAVTVIAALAWTIWSAILQLRQQPIDLRQVNFARIALAVPAYILAMAMSWIFWHRVLFDLDQKPKLGKSIRSFFSSQLGKYVPGKAMVIIIRADLVRDEGVGVAPAAASVFVETFTWIFVGSVIGGLLLVLQFPEKRIMQLAALVMMLAAGVFTWPPVFNRIASNIRPGDDGKANYLVKYSTMMIGWIALTIGWCLNALSLWLVVSALPGADPTARDFLLMLATVTLATVGGFVSLIPGGLGVRELVIIPLIGSQFGSVIAVISAIIVRIVWLAAEVTSVAIIQLYLFVRLTKSQ